MMTSSSVSYSLNNIHTPDEQLNIIYEKNEEQSKQSFEIRQLFNLNRKKFKHEIRIDFK